LGKYVLKPKINVPDSPKDTDKKPDGISTAIPGGGDATGAVKDATAKYFDNMTPEQKKDHEDQLKKVDKFLTPTFIKMAQDTFPALKPKDPNEPPAPVVSMGTDPGPDGDPPGRVDVMPLQDVNTPTDSDPVVQQVVDAFVQAEINQENNPLTQDAFIVNSVAGNAIGEGDGPVGTVTVGEMGPAQGDADGITGVTDGDTAPASTGTAGSSGTSSGMGGMGTGAAGATTSGVSPGVAAAAANAAAAAAVGNAVGGASSGSSSGSGSGASASGMGGMGTGAAGAAASAAAGGGGGGGGGGCCFIMLEARYGDGTMDRVVRRYRDEKVTERNKRGYYKLAEVLIPLMRKSKLFSFLVVKTFADPAVCYAKWYYGENKWGWVFKPLERFWMGLFDTLGTETKFIRENGEVV
jgi:hypothetical protein